MAIDEEKKKKLKKLLHKSDPAMKDIFDKIEADIERIKEEVKESVMNGTIDEVEESLDEIKDMIISYESSTQKLIKGVYPSIKESVNESAKLVNEAKDELNKRIDAINYDSHFKKIRDHIEETRKGFDNSYLDSNRRISDVSKTIEKIKENIDEFGKKHDGLGTSFSDHAESYKNEVVRFNEEIDKLWKEIKKLLKHAQQDKGYVVQGTTRMLMYLNGVSMSDIFNQFNFIEGSGISMSFNPNTMTRQMDFTISAVTSLSIINPTSGAIDGNNHDFVFSKKPYVIISDAGEYRENHGWSWNAGTMTVTMLIAPNSDLYGKI